MRKETSTKILMKVAMAVLERNDYESTFISDTELKVGKLKIKTEKKNERLYGIIALAYLVGFLRLLATGFDLSFYSLFLALGLIPFLFGGALYLLVYLAWVRDEKSSNEVRILNDKIEIWDEKEIKKMIPMRSIYKVDLLSGGEGTQ